MKIYLIVVLILVLALTLDSSYVSRHSTSLTLLPLVLAQSKIGHNVDQLYYRCPRSETTAAPDPIAEPSTPSTSGLVDVLDADPSRQQC